MANVNITVSNPTAAAVTVGSNTVAARSVSKITVSDTGADAYGWLAAGCAIGPHSGAGFKNRLKGTWLLHRQQHTLAA